MAFLQKYTTSHGQSLAKTNIVCIVIVFMFGLLVGVSSVDYLVPYSKMIGECCIGKVVKERSRDHI
jgi:hypothetical protein